MWFDKEGVIACRHTLPTLRANFSASQGIELLVSDPAYDSTLAAAAAAAAHGTPQPWNPSILFSTWNNIYGEWRHGIPLAWNDAFSQATMRVI